MATFDTGHLFLTFLTPIKTGLTTDLDHAPVSFEQRLRLALGVLPTALQSPATIETGSQSPFARTKRTHFCRLFVIEDTVFNGRVSRNAIARAAGGENPIIPHPIDQLSCPWLVFVADIDAVMDDEDALPRWESEPGMARVRDAYLRGLWRTMEVELREIYSNCHGFDAVDSADDFAAYMAKCQVETTMPFHDYWTSPPHLPQVKARPVGLAGLGLLAVALLAWLIGWTGAASLALTAFAFLKIVSLWRFYKHGTSPMPPAEKGDLPSVLKGLYLQQNFTKFVADTQGASPDDLHEAFGTFLEEHKPMNKLEPTQAPGVVSADAAVAPAAEART